MNTNTNTNININIVYFICINNKIDWESIVRGQLMDIVKSNILSSAKLYIVLAANSLIMIKEAYNLIFTILKYVNNLFMDIETHLENKYEYRGIKKLYDLANIHSSDYFLYLHSKGMFFNNNTGKRTENESILTKAILNDWNNTINVFRKNNNVVRIGLFPAQGDWIWYNFYWTTGMYLRSCENPKITSDRYYYESWLSTSIMKEFDSYSLFSHNIQRFSGIDATNFLNSLKNKII